MPAKVLSAAILGLESSLVEVEADIASGLPSFAIVGLPDPAIQEAKERVRPAIKNSQAVFPKTRVTVNLAPADLRKEGPAYDLPIAFSILACSGQSPAPAEESLLIGELALDGKLRPVNGVLSIALKVREMGIKNLFLPQENAREAGLIEGFEIFPTISLSQLVQHFKGQQKIKPFVRDNNIQSWLGEFELDMSEIKGQEQVKRAMEIAAAGGHNLLMTGPPGAGKTMLAKAMVSILPPLSLEESIEVTKIYSVAGLLDKEKPLVRHRPVRTPHHTASTAAIIGGGRMPRPGEISLAHRGILFLDELPEFQRSVLEALRQPLEDGLVSVSRVMSSLQFPAKFILVAAQNPCPCGYKDDPEKTCTCNASQIIKYQKKISGPLLDRIDLYLEVPRIKFEKLVSERKSENSLSVSQRVIRARQIQENRFGSQKVLVNAEMSNKEVREYCLLEPSGLELLRKAVNQMNLSARAYFRLLKVARTIADLEGREKILIGDLAEALQYRPRG